MKGRNTKMTLQEILKSQGLTEDQITKIVGEMKQNKIFTASEENLDVRYKKLKEQNDTVSSQYSEASKLIEELKKGSAGSEELKGKITAYETQVADLQEKLKTTQLESAIKVALLSAKAVDVDYLTFKLKEKGELNLDDNGNIKNIDDKISALKTQFPTQFETQSQKKFEENKLPEGDGSKKMTKEEFNRLGYRGKAKLFEEDPDLYNEFMGRKSEK